jgi:hypothetical protein
MTIHPNNAGVWHDQRFWCGLVHLATGSVVATYTYEHAEAWDFHTDFILARELDKQLNNGILGYFWINDGVIGGETGDHEEYITPELNARILEQVAITRTCEYTPDGADPTPGSPACGAPATVCNPHGLSGKAQRWFDYDEWYCATHADPAWLTPKAQP